jgi:hypothetical protein
MRSAIPHVEDVPQLGQHQGQERERDRPCLVYPQRRSSPRPRCTKAGTGRTCGCCRKWPAPAQWRRRRTWSAAAHRCVSAQTRSATRRTRFKTRKGFLHYFQINYTAVLCTSGLATTSDHESKHLCHRPPATHQALSFDYTWNRHVIPQKVRHVKVPSTPGKRPGRPTDAFLCSRSSTNASAEAETVLQCIPIASTM